MSTLFEHHTLKSFLPCKLKRAIESKEIVSAHTFTRPPKLWLNVAEEFLLLLLHNRTDDLFKNTLLVAFFQVGSRLIPCHKLVLACVIPYFR